MNGLLMVAEATNAVDPAKVKPGWLALVIVLLMCLATYLLWRSMNRQIGKVHFDDGSPRTDVPQDDDQPTDLPENDGQRT